MSDRPDRPETRPDAALDMPPESPSDTQPIAPQAPPDVPETPLVRAPSEERQAAAPEAGLPLPPAPLEPPDFATEEHVAVAVSEQATRPTLVPPADEVPRFVKKEAPAIPLPEGEGHCPRCGSTDLGQGGLITYGTRFRPAYFKPSRLSFFRLHNALRPFRQLIEVEAQVCRHCGLVMVQVDPARLAKVERRSDDPH